MTEAQRVTFVSHTNKPGGGELALRRYLEATQLPVRLVTLEAGGVWDGLKADVDVVGGLRDLRRELRGEEMVVANSMRSAFLTALVLRRPTRLVYWVRDGLTDSAMSRLALILTKQVTARRASHYLANSAWTASTVREVLRVTGEQIDVIHSMCGVNADHLAARARRHPRSPLRLLYLGRLAPWKAPDLAVRSLRELRASGVEATLTIAGGVHFGEDTYAAELRDLVEAEPAASLVGHVEDVPSLLEDHDVLVHCSIVPEPFGQVIVQGLAAGMPVVASDAGGPAEILADAPVGSLYPLADVEGLAARVRENAAKYAEASSWATGRARDYTDQQLASLMDRTLERLQAGATS